MKKLSLPSYKKYVVDGINAPHIYFELFEKLEKVGIKKDIIRTLETHLVDYVQETQLQYELQIIGILNKHLSEIVTELVAKTLAEQIQKMKPDELEIAIEIDNILEMEL